MSHNFHCIQRTKWSLHPNRIHRHIKDTIRHPCISRNNPRILCRSPLTLYSSIHPNKKDKPLPFLRRLRQSCMSCRSPCNRKCHSHNQRTPPNIANKYQSRRIYRNSSRNYCRHCYYPNIYYPHRICTLMLLLRMSCNSMSISGSNSHSPRYNTHPDIPPNTRSKSRHNSRSSLNRIFQYKKNTLSISHRSNSLALPHYSNAKATS